MIKAWVIGGRRGIGKAITLELERHEVFVSPTDEDSVDVTSFMQLARAYENFQPNWIVYCAGVNKLMRAEEFDDFDGLAMLDINALGFMRVISLATRTPFTHSIVAISSDAATHPMRNSMAYCASKAALSMAVRCAARELAPAIRVNAVAPGPVANTTMTEQVNEAVAAIKGWSAEQVEEDVRKGVPMRRRAYMEEVAHVVYTTLDGPEYLTGSIIEINGGR